MTGGVVRRWEAVMERSDLAPWLEAFRTRALPAQKAVEGFLGATIHAERDRDPCRITVPTAWRDMDAVRRASGEEAARAVVPDFMAPFFVSHDAEATFHDELLTEANR